MKQSNKLKTEWDLSVLYSSPQDPAIEKDVVAIERSYEAFEKKYRNSDFTSDNKKLLSALEDYETVADTTGSGKPIVYFSYRRELDSTDADAEAKIRLISDRFTKAGNKIRFFDLSLGKLSVDRQKSILNDQALSRYHYMLKRIFETAKHDLTEAEEKIMALKSGTSYDMWVSGVDASINKKAVLYKGKQMPVNGAINEISKIKNTTARRKLWINVIKKLRETQDFAEYEMNAIYTNKKINDEIRSYKEPYDATIMGYENEAASILLMVDAVTKRFDISKRFYEIKKRLLKIPEMRYPDRGIDIGKTSMHYSFEKAASIVREAFGSVDQRYADIFDGYLKNGQIDVFPKNNKSGGAFCSGSHRLPSFILLNHVDDFRSFTTLAHEMGHGIHTERSKQQPVLYEGYSTAVAETASTFFEGLAFEHEVKSWSEKQRVIALHDRLQDEIATIFRQIAFFNFELELHRAVRAKGFVPKEEIALMLNRHMASYMGSAVTLKDEDGYFFITVSHFRRFFYVYSYAYGQLISKALLARVRADKKEIKQVDQFLSAGGSKSPEDIFASIGIDARSPKLFEEGLDAIERDVAELDRLTRKR